MTHFSVICNYPDTTYRIECLFIVYRGKFGHHPDFIKVDEEAGKRDGFATKFYYLIEDDLSKAEADAKLAEYQQKYDTLVSDIENDDKRWNEFPFKNNTIVYSK